MTTENYNTEELIECKFCSRLMGNYIRHLPPECRAFRTNRLSKTVNPFDDNWPGVEDVNVYR
jgi:hypothetical protein